MKTKITVYSRRKLGRAFIGAYKDAGWRTHAVPNKDNIFCYEKPLCGIKPGMTSNGWGSIENFKITCKKCLEKIDRDANIEVSLE